MSERRRVSGNQRPNGHAEDRVILTDSFFDKSEEEARRSSRTTGEAAGGIGDGHPGTTQPLHPVYPEQGGDGEDLLGRPGAADTASAPTPFPPKVLTPVQEEEIPFVPKVSPLFVALILLGFVFGAIALIVALWVMSSSASKSDTKAIARKVVAEEIRPLEDKLKTVENQSKGTLDELSGLKARVHGVEKKPDLTPRIVKIEHVDSSQSARISRLRRELKVLQDAYKSGQMESYPAIPGNRIDTGK